jgi:hypothetical protein
MSVEEKASPRRAPDEFLAIYQLYRERVSQEDQLGSVDKVRQPDLCGGET